MFGIKLHGNPGLIVHLKVAHIICDEGSEKVLLSVVVSRFCSVPDLVPERVLESVFSTRP